MTKMTTEEKAELKAKKAKEKQELALAKEEAARVVPLKKLPKIYKKTYTQKQLEKKLYKKIFIADDLKFVKSLYKEAGKNKKDIEVFAIPQEKLFSKKEVLRLKDLTKDIKSQKGRIRWIPLIATVAFFAAIVIGISLTRNIIIKKAITSTCESIFQAKCDIDYVNLRLFDSSFKLRGLQIANKKEPMKNLISIGSITFDFDLLQLLRSRFVADELSILDVATNTDRKYSGDISAQRRAKIAKKRAKKAAKAAKKTESSAFMKSLEAKYNTAANTLKASVTDVFNQYNPENIAKNIYANLETPDAAKQAQDTATKLVEKYKAMPEKFAGQVNEVKATAEAVAAINLQELKNDPVKIKKAIDTIQAAQVTSQKLKSETEKTVNDMKADVNTASKLSSSLQKAIKHDTDLVGSEINKITSFKLEDGKNYITGTFDTIGYQLLGKYYPTAKQLVDYLVNAKNNNKPKKEKKAAKKEKTKAVMGQRAAGRTVYYKADTTPKFWIKKAAGSGPNFYFDALNITNNMDKTGKPATGNFTLNFAEIDHTAKLIVDTRSNSKDALITANYNCDKLPLSYPTSKMGDVPGVPGIESTKSNLDFVFKIFEDEGFSISGMGIFTDLILTTIPFEPEFAYTIYNNVLSSINSMRLGVTAGYTVSNGIDLRLTSDADKQFATAITKELNAQLNSLKAKIQEELSAKINEYTGGALGDLNDFESIASKINDYANFANKAAAQIENKLKEAQNAANEKAKAAVEDATNAAKEKTQNAINDATNAAKEKAKESLKGMLTR